MRVLEILRIIADIVIADGTEAAAAWKEECRKNKGKEAQNPGKKSQKAHQRLSTAIGLSTAQPKQEK